MYVSELIDTLQAMMKKHGNLHIMANHETISSVDHIQSEESMPEYINLEIN